MANEVILKIRVLNSTLGPIQNDPVLLLNPITDTYNLKQSQQASSSVVFSGTSDADGFVNFTGVQAGTYDIRVINNVSGNSTFNYGYVVKNSYVVDPINNAESRFAVRSGEHIQGVSAGILARSNDNPQGTMYSSYTWGRNPIVPGDSVVGAEATASIVGGTGNTQYQDPMNGNLFTPINTTSGKLSGTSYYHDNQNLLNTQKIDIVLR